MKVLSVQQPYAQLIARDIKRHEVRPWITAYRGRIAIHASAAVPPSQLLHDAVRDKRFGRELRFQGWDTMDALTALPRSAIVATVELVRIVRAREVCPAPPLVGELEGDEFLWELSDPVEIEPVRDVRGKQKLWSLPDHVASTVTEAEQRMRASLAESPRPREIEASRRALARLDETEPFWQEMKKSAERPKVPPRKKPVRRFRKEEFEAFFTRTVAQYCAGHQVRETEKGKEVKIDHRIRMMAALFRRRDWVPVEEFESSLREFLDLYGGAQRNYLRGRSWDSDDDLVEFDPSAGEPYDSFSGIQEFRDLGRFVEGKYGRGREMVNGEEDQIRHDGRLRPWREEGPGPETADE